MPVNKKAYEDISVECEAKGVTLVAVSKTKPNADILELYQMGHRDFGENYVQEMEAKYEALPKDIRWHFIGHLQSNKVKQIAGFVHLVHGVDSDKLLKEINKQGEKLNRVIDCLCQVYIASEETKFGLDETEVSAIVGTAPDLSNVSVRGLMGMASFSNDEALLRNEFSHLAAQFKQISHQLPGENRFDILSMGMSADYQLAIEEGSTMIRVGSLLFGER